MCTFEERREGKGESFELAIWGKKGRTVTTASGKNMSLDEKKKGVSVFVGRKKLGEKNSGTDRKLAEESK